MFCSNCGTRLPDDANFCMKCGKALRSNLQQSDEVQWETCQISALVDSDFLVEFTVDAIGPKGRYVVATDGYALEIRIFGENGDYPEQRPEKAEKAVDNLIKKLTQDGWESTGKKEKWWEYTFRRRL